MKTRVQLCMKAKTYKTGHKRILCTATLMRIFLLCSVRIVVYCFLCAHAVVTHFSLCCNLFYRRLTFWKVSLQRQVIWENCAERFSIYVKFLNVFRFRLLRIFFFNLLLRNYVDCYVACDVSRISSVTLMYAYSNH